MADFRTKTVPLTWRPKGTIIVAVGVHLTAGIPAAGASHSLQGGYRPMGWFFRQSRIRRRAWAARLAIPGAVEAARLMHSGQFGEAADRFERLAQEEQQRGRTVVAAGLFLRATRCRLQIDDPPGTERCAVRAVHLLIEARQVERLGQVMGRLLPALERSGQHSLAQRLRNDVEKAFPGIQMSSVPLARQASVAAQLPARCPTCGGPLKPDEVDWVGPGTAECPFCGGMIKA